MFSNLRNAKILTLAFFLILGMLVATLHNDAASKGRGFWLEDAITAVIKPLQQEVNSVGGAFNAVAQYLRTRNSMVSEIKQLRKEVNRLSMETAQLREAAHQNIQLKQSLKL